MVHPQRKNIFFYLAVVAHIFVSQTSSKISMKISIGNNGVVTWGEDVDITCSIGEHQIDGTFTLTRSSFRHMEHRKEAVNKATFKIPKVNFTHEGMYWCHFSNGTVSANNSENLLIDSVGALQPRISLTYDGKEVQAPDKAGVTWGDSFVLTCSINCSCPQGNFTLNFSGSSANRIEPAVNRTASFHFPRAAFGHRGNYSCTYNATRFPIKQEESLGVIITFPFMLLIISLSAGVPPMLLVVCLVVFLLRRRRRKLKIPQTQSQIQMTVQDNDEDEEDNDYVNIGEEQRAGGTDEEDADYEEMEDDDPYVHPLQHIRGEQEYTDTSSDDDNDYVNLAQSENVDIYGDDEEDLYQNF